MRRMINSSNLEDDYLSRCANAVVEIVAGRESFEGFQSKQWQWLKDLGINPESNSQEVTFGSSNRDCSEIMNPVIAIQNCARWIRGQTNGAARAFPMCELIFMHGESQFGPLIRSHWEKCALGRPEIVKGNRMIAPKAHPIWEEFSDFSRPWPPFFKQEVDANRELSLVLQSVSRSDSIDLGIPRASLIHLLEIPPDSIKYGASELLAVAWRANNDFCPVPGKRSAVIPRYLWF